MDPRVGHLKVVKQVVQYLKRIMQLGWINGIQSQIIIKTKSEKATQVLFSSPPFKLFDYAHSNYVSDSEEKKSARKNYFFVYRAIVFWYSNKQYTVLTLTTKAEYITLGYTA